MVRPSACLTQSSDENRLVLAEVDPGKACCGTVGDGMNSESAASEMRFYRWRSDIRRPSIQMIHIKLAE
jgi:hypothetical protein